MLIVYKGNKPISPDQDLKYKPKPNRIAPITTRIILSVLFKLHFIGDFP